MSNWEPGRPVLTEDDREAWQIWRRQRILAAQRHRRATLRRIDYYPSPEAAEAIDSLTVRSVGGDYSSVIDRLVLARRASGIE